MVKKEILKNHVKGVSMLDFNSDSNDKVHMKRIRIDSIQIDRISNGGYQPKLMPARVKQIVENFNIFQLQAVTCNIRQTGEIYLVDGQHRLEACRLLGHETILSFIEYGLTQALESVRFRQLNNEKRGNLGRLTDFNAKVVAGDSEAIHIQNILNGAGLKIGSHKHDSIGDIGSIQWVHDNFGAPILNRALNVLSATWGKNQNSYQLPLLDSFAYFFNNHPDANDQRIIEQFCTLQPKKVINDINESAKKAFPNQTITKMLRAQQGQREITTIYNRKLRNRLQYK